MEKYGQPDSHFQMLGTERVSFDFQRTWLVINANDDLSAVEKKIKNNTTFCPSLKLSIEKCCASTCLRWKDAGL